MKITLVIPPSPFLLDDRVFPFLGPLQIGALARSLGHEVAVADLTGYKRRHPGKKHVTFDDVLEEAKVRLVDIASGSDLVGFYSLAAQHPGVMKLKEALLQAHPGCVTVLGRSEEHTSEL